VPVGKKVSVYELQHRVMPSVEEAPAGPSVPPISSLLNGPLLNSRGPSLSSAQFAPFTPRYTKSEGADSAKAK